MIFNFTKKTDVIVAVDAEEISDVVRATTVDETQIKQLQDEIRQKDAETKRREADERKRLAELKSKQSLKMIVLMNLKRNKSKNKRKR